MRTDRRTTSRVIRHGMAIAGIACSLVLQASCNADSDVLSSADTPDALDIDTRALAVDTSSSADDITASAPPAWASSLDSEIDYLGFATVDITPDLLEPYEDLNNNGRFDGCLDDPLATRDDCDEPFDDLDGDGVYDGAFLAGFGDRRAATGVHDPITARATAFTRIQADGHWNAALLISLDLVGLGNDHIMHATDRLAAELGLGVDQVIVTSTHNHQGPDVRGMWGSLPEWSGANPEYNAAVRDDIVRVGLLAFEGLQPAQIRIAQTRLRDRSKWFSGARFQGQHPQPYIHGLLNDIRDPIVVDDTVTLLSAATSDGEPLGSIVMFAGHPELVGSDNTLLSADYVHFVRKRLEEVLGGDCVFVSTALGGMMSALGAEVPLVDASGAWVAPEGVPPTEVGLNGISAPVWAAQQTFDHARSFAVHVADAALAALSSTDNQETLTLTPFTTESEGFAVPPDNGELLLMYRLGIFDVDSSYQEHDPTVCPEAENVQDIGCLRERVWHWRIGEFDLLTAPGELLPELFSGVPKDDPQWSAESSNPALRGASRDSRYWRHHPPECDTALWSECQQVETLEIERADGTMVMCKCVNMHIVPYTTQPIGENVVGGDPIELLSGDYRVLIGNAGDHLGYIIQATDFHRKVSQLVGDSGDHYEETVAVSYRTAERWYDALRSLLTKNGD